ncbi:hypothetical protein N9U65_03725 [Planctomycetaceae bacterium]|nr:hypothetical protein [Planctomycetaceae bacterium]
MTYLLSAENLFSSYLISSASSILFVLEMVPGDRNVLESIASPMQITDSFALVTKTPSGGDNRD